jgi:hypothetical protein
VSGGDVLRWPFSYRDLRSCLRGSVLLDVCAARLCGANVDAWISATASARLTSQPA